MKLAVQPASAADFDTARDIYGPTKGDLTAAALPMVWPVESTDLTTIKTRLDWSCQQQKDVVENDPTVRLIKVVDLDNKDEIIAIGRWHRYPEGFQQFGDLEVCGLKDRNDPNTWPVGLDKALLVGFCDSSMDDRREWLGEDHCWVLTNVVTREPFRRRGAGSLILEWGLREAAKEKVPAYLEALAVANSLYKRHGFREVAEEKHGAVKMRADPQL